MFEWSKYDAIFLPVTFLLMICTGALLRLILRGKKPYIRQIPLVVLSLIIIPLEISKQVYFNFLAEYNYYVLPLHFCSLFIFIMPLSQCLGNTAAKIFKGPTFVYSFLVLALVLVHPRALLGNSTRAPFASFHNFHAFFYHMVVIAYFIFSLWLTDYVPNLTDGINITAGVAVYATYAVPFAFKLETNYVNILYSNFKPLENFRLWAGQVWYDVVLFLVAVTALSAIFLVYYFSFEYIKKHKFSVLNLGLSTVNLAYTNLKNKKPPLSGFYGAANRT